MKLYSEDPADAMYVIYYLLFMNDTSHIIAELLFSESEREWELEGEREKTTSCCYNKKMVGPLLILGEGTPSFLTYVRVPLPVLL